MLEGLWTVKFESNFGILGFGTAVFISNRILGGDSGYYYDGKVIIENNNAIIEARIVRYNNQFASIFGNLDIFNLKIEGAIREPEMVLSGLMVENPTLKITVRCTKRTAI